MDIIAGIIVGMLVAWTSFSIIFDSKEDFDENTKDPDTPGLLDALKGEHPKDPPGDFGINLWLAISISSGFCAYKFVQWAYFG